MVNIYSSMNYCNTKFNLASKHKQQPFLQRRTWKDSLAIQELLDVVCQIIADEYVTVRKENPKIFTTGRIAMRAAIYARYSSENQSEKSIDDQIRVCKKYCTEHNITTSDKQHLY